MNLNTDVIRLDKQALITCSDITIRFGDEVVLEELSFQIPEGKHTVFKGESGSGKSTLLQLLLGFLTPSEGSIQFRDNKEAKEIRRITAWLPQDLNLGSGTLNEVMQKPFEFSANQKHKPGSQASLSIITRLGLSEEDITKRFRDLSTGQRQRVGLAICYLLDKPLLLLDEPTSALDMRSKEKAAKLLIAHTNKTVVSTSHDPFWLEYADKIIELR